MKQFFLIAFLSTGLHASSYYAHLSSAWYPSKSKMLKEKLLSMKQSAAQSVRCGSPSFSSVRALIVPHAGYDYSGVVATAGFQALQGQTYQRVIILAPAHQADFSGVALPSRAYDTLKGPLGRVALDIAVLEQLIKKSPLFVSRQIVHDREHAVEVQIPFLQTYVPGVKIVPLLVGSVTAQDIAEIAHMISQYFDDSTLLVVSSDLTYVGERFGCQPFKKNILKNIQQLDEQLLAAIQQKNADALRAIVATTGAKVCGKHVILILLELLQETINKDVVCRVVAYDTSDHDQKAQHCVGYGAVVFGK